MENVKTISASMLAKVKMVFIKEIDNFIICVGDDGNDYVYNKKNHEWQLWETKEELYDLEDVFNAVVESFGNTRETLQSLIETYLTFRPVNEIEDLYF